MGIFSNIKKMFKKEEDKETTNSSITTENKNESETEKQEEEKIKLYDKGLSKSRENFVDKLINLNNKTKKIIEYINNVGK